MYTIEAASLTGGTLSIVDGTLSIVECAQTADLALLGNNTSSDFTVSDDDHSGTFVKFV